MSVKKSVCWVSHIESDLQLSCDANEASALHQDSVTGSKEWKCLMHREKT
jgi:hypothetical protein